MTKYYLIFVFLILTFINHSAAGSDTKKNNRIPTQTNRKNQYLPNKIVIKFNSATGLGKTVTGLPAVDKILRKNNIYQIEPVSKNKNRLIKQNLYSSIDRIYFAWFTGNRSPESLAEELSREPNIEYAEPLYIYKTNVIPNDPFYSNQAYLQAIKLPEAWDIVKGEQGEVIIAIVDGGTEINHSDLAANLWVNPDEIADNGIDDDNNGLIDDIHGWNFADNSNNPTGLSSTPFNAWHGTWTAGIAAGVSNNGIGATGSSWNAKLMAINASSAQVDSVIVYGYTGILYAAEKGADIINLSWGALNSPTLFGQDIISFALESGSAIVAAAGNDDTNEPHYPSAYPDVLSIAAISNNGTKASFSNYGPTIDAAAPGINILNTTSNNNYSLGTGTSASAPIVAGILALIKTQHPNWTGVQVKEQLRVTSDNIDDINPSFAGQLGRGRINALRAVTDTTLLSIRISAVEFADSDSNGIIQPGERVNLIVRFFNYLNPVSNVNIKLIHNDPFISLINDNSSISRIETLEEVTLASPLSFQVSGDTPRNHIINFKIEISAGNYNDTGYFDLTVLPNFANTFANNINTTITNNGRIGFADTDNQTDGIGFHYKQGTNLLFEGAIIAGTGPGQIVDAARSVTNNGELQYHSDFTVTENGEIRIINPGTISDQETFTMFNDVFTQFPLNIQVEQQTFSWQDSGYENFIIFNYTIKNIGSGSLNNFFFGIFFDWDIDGYTLGTNVAEFDNARNLGYVYDSSSDLHPYAGMALLSDHGVSYRAIYNDKNHEDNPHWGIYDGFENSEKWSAISGGVTNSEAGPADVSHVIASGPHLIRPKNSIKIGFALVAGENLGTIQVAVDSAKSLYDKFIPSSELSTPPEIFELFQNHPNPFVPVEGPTLIRYHIADINEVELIIYNLLGQKIITLVNKRQVADTYEWFWTGRDDSGRMVPSGIYFYRLKTGNFIKTRKLLLVR